MASVPELEVVVSATVVLVEEAIVLVESVHTRRTNSILKRDS